ncbi:hypothetical protein PR048_010473 [Dryococelus australis]|uniref:Uncharacterized protein n=1 Tax=Dryococelus australis TaxID=614101 RepID=A0ABQ9I3Y3_9NEOP|nr:hypothetical protein PR048_010473 [Dryococelus australis]
MKGWEPAMGCVGLVAVGGGEGGVSWRIRAVLNLKSSRAVMLPVSSSLSVEGGSIQPIGEMSRSTVNNGCNYTTLRATDRRISKCNHPERSVTISCTASLPRCREQLFRHSFGAPVAERPACSSPTKATRAQSPAGSLRIFACGNRAGRLIRAQTVNTDQNTIQPIDKAGELYSALNSILSETSSRNITHHGIWDLNENTRAIFASNHNMFHSAKPRSRINDYTLFTVKQAFRKPCLRSTYIHVAYNTEAKQPLIPRTSSVHAAKMAALTSNMRERRLLISIPRNQWYLDFWLWPMGMEFCEGSTASRESFATRSIQSEIGPSRPMRHNKKLQSNDESKQVHTCLKSILSSSEKREFRESLNVCTHESCLTEVEGTKDDSVKHKLGQAEVSSTDGKCLNRRGDEGKRGAQRRTYRAPRCIMKSRFVSRRPAARSYVICTSDVRARLHDDQATLNLQIPPDPHFCINSTRAVVRGGGGGNNLLSQDREVLMDWQTIYFPRTVKCSWTGNLLSQDREVLMDWQTIYFPRTVKCSWTGRQSTFPGPAHGLADNLLSQDREVLMDWQTIYFPRTVKCSWTGRQSTFPGPHLCMQPQRTMWAPSGTVLRRVGKQSGISQGFINASGCPYNGGLMHVFVLMEGILNISFSADYKPSHMYPSIYSERRVECDTLSLAVELAVCRKTSDLSYLASSVDDRSVIVHSRLLSNFSEAMLKFCFQDIHPPPGNKD